MLRGQWRPRRVGRVDRMSKKGKLEVNESLGEEAKEKRETGQ